MAFLGTTIKKKETAPKAFLGTTIKKPDVQDYRGTLGELPMPVLGRTQTSTQAMPDARSAQAAMLNPVTFVKGAAQAVARTVGAVGVTAGNLPTRLVNTGLKNPLPLPFEEDISTKGGKITEALFGGEPIRSLQSQGGELYEGLKPSGDLAARMAVGPVLAGLIIGDLFGGRAQGAKIFNRAAQGTKTAEEAYTLAKSAGFEEDVARQYAPLWAKETTAKGTQQVTDAAVKLQNTTDIVHAKAYQEVLQDVVDNHPGKGLGNTINYRTGEFVKGGDTKYQNRVGQAASGGGDLDIAVRQADEFKRLEAQLKAVKAEVKKVDNGVPKTEFKLSNDAIRRGEEMAVASKRASITDPEELLKFIDREGDGNVGVFLKPEEKKLLGDYLNSIDNLELKGAIIGRERRASNEGRDLVLGKVNDRFIVVGETGAGAGKVRIHRTPMGISGDKVLGKIDTQLFLDSFTATPTRSRQAQAAPGAAASHPTLQTSPEIVLRETALPPTSPQGVSLPELNHISGENASGFTRAVGIGEKTTKEPNLYRRVVDKLAKAFNSTVEVVQDKERLVRKLMERKDMKVSDATNVYQKMTLYTGRTARKVELAHERMETVANDIVNIASDSGREIANVRADINRYLHALHAPERNVALGDGAAGMTTEAAVKELERIAALPNAVAIKKAAEDMRKLNAEGLGLLREAGVISDELFTTLTKKYPNHVPLNRIFEGEEIQSALSIRGYDVRSTGIKKAKGSEREVADILANIQHNYEQAVLRSEKNIVDQATFGFVRENETALKGMMEIKKPRAVGKDFKGRMLMEHTTDPQYLQLYENGKPIWIHITDPDLAAAMRGVGADKLPKVLHAVGAFTRLMAGLATRFNPEFALPNKLRDLQETMVYAAAQKDLGFSGAAKISVKDPASMKAVTEFYLGKDTAGARLYKEMQELGGTTGGLGLSTRKQVELDIDKMIETAASRPRQMFADVVTYIDNWNAIFEDSTRLSVYKQALAQGATKERAAFLAKEASINFNRMGRGGPVINALYMFSNASIQGSAKMIRSLKNPKVAATVITTVGASVAAVNQWNDRIDPEWRDKVTRWDRLNSLPIIIPNGKGEGVTYISIPVSWGLKPIKVMADFAYDAASGITVDAARVTGDLFTAVLEAYNPLGGTDFTSTLVPTIADMPVEIARNQSWSGSKIRPDFDQNAPADVQYFKDLRETAAGRLFIEGAKGLQEMTGIAISPADAKYAFEQLIGGAGRFGVKTSNTALGVATGEPPPLDEYPFVSRFYRERDEEETGQGAGGEIQEVNKLLQTQSRERFYAKQEAEKLYEQWNQLPKEEARAKWNALNAEDPETAKKVAKIAKDEVKGLTYLERQITELGVENGERAKYLYQKFKELETKEEKRQLWELYSKKGILTEGVASQIRMLVANPALLDL